MLWPWFAAESSPCQDESFTASFVPCSSTLKVQVEPVAKGYFYIGDPFFPGFCHVLDWCFHMVCPCELQWCPLAANRGLSWVGLGLCSVLVHRFFCCTGEVNKVWVVRGNGSCVPELVGVVFCCHLATKDHIVDVASFSHFAGVSVLCYQPASRF